MIQKNRWSSETTYHSIRGIHYRSTGHSAVSTGLENGHMKQCRPTAIKEIIYPYLNRRMNTGFLSDIKKINEDPHATPVPSTGIVKSTVSVLVECDRETAFNYIASSVKLHNWMKKSGPIKAVKSVEILEGPYTKVGAQT